MAGSYAIPSQIREMVVYSEVMIEVMAKMAPNFSKLPALIESLAALRTEKKKLAMARHRGFTAELNFARVAGKILFKSKMGAIMVALCWAQRERFVRSVCSVPVVVPEAHGDVQQP